MTLPDRRDDVLAIAAGALEHTPEEVVRLSSFAGNRVFRVVAGSRSYYFKFGDAHDIARELAALQLAGAAGVPVPGVQAADLDGRWSPHPLVVLREVEGRPLEGSEPELGLLGDIVARWHAVGLPGFGTATVDGGGLRGEEATWASALRGRAASARPVAAVGLVPDRLIDRTLAAIDLLGPMLVLPQGRLLHGDLHPRHVYAAKERIVAVIDWGDATIGDPDYDLARVLHARLLRGDIETAVATAASLLPEGARSVEAARLSKLLLYAAVFICWSMAGELKGGAPWPPWWPVQSAALSRILGLLDEATA